MLGSGASGGDKGGDANEARSLGSRRALQVSEANDERGSYIDSSESDELDRPDMMQRMRGGEKQSVATKAEVCGARPRRKAEVTTRLRKARTVLYRLAGMRRSELRGRSRSVNPLERCDQSARCDAPCGVFIPPSSPEQVVITPAVRSNPES